MSQAAVTKQAPCKGCSASVRLAPGEAERILRQFLRGHPHKLADEATWKARLAACEACPDLLYGTTCRHCGCLAAVRVRLADKHCPNPRGRAW